MENELIKWLTEQFPTSSNFRSDPSDVDGQFSIAVGIGDDAAVVAGGAQRLVLTSDAIIENIHFDSSVTCEQIGRKALAVNLSDLASMAARPVAVIVNLCLPNLISLEEVKRLYFGMSPLIEQYDLQVIGGDTNVGSTELIVSITAIGLEPDQGVTRLSGAQTGDRIVVSGSFGGSRARKHFAFEPRCEMALHLVENYQVNAATDVSDGLSLDLFRMATASNLGFSIDSESIPISNELKLSDREERLKHALGDGEDFELILAIPPAQLEKVLDDPLFGSDLTEIGQFTNKRQEFIIVKNGVSQPLEPTGYLH